MASLVLTSKFSPLRGLVLLQLAQLWAASGHLGILGVLERSAAHLVHVATACLSLSLCFWLLMGEAWDGEQRRLAKQAQGAWQEAPQEVPAEAEGDLYAMRMA